MEYSIKQVAGMLNMTEHTIRYYTDINLFPCRRGRGNRRIFDEESVNWLIGIKTVSYTHLDVYKRQVLE